MHECSPCTTPHWLEDACTPPLWPEAWRDCNSLRGSSRHDVDMGADAHRVARNCADAAGRCPVRDTAADTSLRCRFHPPQQLRSHGSHPYLFLCEPGPFHRYQRDTHATAAIRLQLAWLACAGRTGMGRVVEIRY